MYSPWTSILHRPQGVEHTNQTTVHHTQQSNRREGTKVSNCSQFFFCGFSMHLPHVRCSFRDDKSNALAFFRWPPLSPSVGTVLTSLQHKVVGLRPQRQHIGNSVPHGVDCTRRPVRAAGVLQGVRFETGGARRDRNHYKEGG